MDSPLSIRREQKETSVNGKIPGNFDGQSPTTKLAQLLGRERVVDYVGYFSHWILVIPRPGDASENSTDDRHEKIEVGRFIQRYSIPYSRLMCQYITFIAEYFIVQVLTPFHQHRISLSQDMAPRNLICILMIYDAFRPGQSLMKCQNYDASRQCILPIPLT
jgi:hypothetical protein